MSDLSKLSAGDEVAMLVPMTAPDLDGCRYMYWVKGEVVAVEARYVTARHGDHECRYAIDSGEQVNGRGLERGPGWIQVLNEAARMRIAESALKKSEYERRCSALEVIADMIHSLTTEALERTAAFIAGEEEIVDAV